MGESKKTEEWKDFILLLKNEVQNQKLKNDKLSELTGYSEKIFERIFNLKFCPKLEIVIAVAKAINFDYSRFNFLENEK